MRPAVLTLAALSCVTAFADPVVYNSYAAWDAAIASPITAITFSHLTASGDIPMNGYTESGATFSSTSGYLYGRSNSGGWIYGPPDSGSGNWTNVDVPGGAQAIGLDLGRFYNPTLGVSTLTEIELSTGHMYQGPVGSYFLGFISSVPITQVRMRVPHGPASGTYNLTSDYPIIYNAYLVSSVPEGSTFLISGLGLLGVGLGVHRRKRRIA